MIFKICYSFFANNMGLIDKEKYPLIHYLESDVMKTKANFLDLVITFPLKTTKRSWTKKNHLKSEWWGKVMVNNYGFWSAEVWRDRLLLPLPWRSSLMGTELHFWQVSVGSIWHQEVETPVPLKMFLFWVHMLISGKRMKGRTIPYLDRAND